MSSSPLVSDADCAPFNLSIDTYSPTLVNICFESSKLRSNNLDELEKFG